ncbi:diguanylate cyclase [Vibrio mediterranei]|uniref:diguanylate cyclase n=1 Tax=Vibrio mediterranei TaxID=689 RepID=UPI0009D64B07
MNDQYGHAIGDKVIVGFAEHIKRSVLYPCTIIRLGGDEFTSIIHNRLLKDILNNLVKSLSSFNIVLPIGSVYSVRVSIGFASVSCLHGFDTAIALADKEMYLNKKRAKSKGD